MDHTLMSLPFLASFYFFLHDGRQSFSEKRENIRCYKLLHFIYFFLQDLIVFERSVLCSPRLCLFVNKINEKK